MANNTPNYALVKPAYNEWADITILNNNLDIIDTQIFAKASKTRQIIAGLGLTGGGDLTTDRTLNIVSANAGIVVNADNIELKPATTSIIGGVKIGADMTVSADGTINPLLNQTTADGRYVNVAGDTMTGGLAAASLTAANGTNTAALYVRYSNITTDQMYLYNNATDTGIYNRMPTHGDIIFFSRNKSTGVVTYAGGTFNGNVTAPNIITNTSIGTCTTLFSGTQQCGQNTWKDTGIDIPTTYSSVLIGVNIASSGLYDTEIEFSRCTLARGETLLFAHQTQDERIIGKIVGNRLWTYTSAGNMGDNSLKTVIGITRR